MGMAVVSATVPPKKKKTSVSQRSSVVFFDDFSGKTLDRSKWNVRINDGVVNNEQQAYVDSSATLYISHGA